MRIYFRFFLIVLIAILATGCGGGNGITEPPPGNGNDDPVIPEDPECTHFLFGSAEFEFNEDSGQIERIPQHTVQVHYNLTDPFPLPFVPIVSP